MHELQAGCEVVLKDCQDEVLPNMMIRKLESALYWVIRKSNVFVSAQVKLGQLLTGYEQ